MRVRQKAAKQRKDEAAILTSEAIALWNEHCGIAEKLRHVNNLGSAFPLLSKTLQSGRITNPGTRENWRQQMKACLRLLQLALQESKRTSTLARVSDGLILVRSPSVLKEVRVFGGKC